MTTVTAIFSSAALVLVLLLITAYDFAPAQQIATPQASTPPRRTSQETTDKVTDVEKPETVAAWFPPGLILLIPAFLVLGVRAFYEMLYGRKATDGAGDESPNGAPKDSTDTRNRWLEDPNALLILVALFVWFITFLLLNLTVGATGKIAFFGSLDVPMFVPVLGFLGSVIFVADLFRKGREDIRASTEFAMRILLGPFVAVVVILFTDSVGLTGLKNNTQAMGLLAFFSGFLVVLALQGLTEWGNEILGRWRSRYRYEPTEIAKAFDLDRDTSAKLTQVHLRSLEELRALSTAALEERAKIVGFEIEFLKELQREAKAIKQRSQKEALRAELDERFWDALKQDGAGTVTGFAMLPQDRVAAIADAKSLDKEMLLRFHAQCREAIEA